MSDQLALLRGILEEPADDAPRLVYADWLEEHAGFLPCKICNGKGRTVEREPWMLPGEGWAGPCRVCNGSCRGESNGFAERAAFIRVQIELAKWQGKDGEHCPQCGRHWRFGTSNLSGRGSDYWCNADHKWTSGDYQALRRREQELVGPQWERWAGTTELRPSFFCENLWVPKPTPTPHVTFHRGFIEQITCPGDMLARVVDSVCPDLEPECPQCIDMKRWAKEWDCPTCHGLGTVPRVLTGAEQPCREIRLTDLSNLHVGVGSFNLSVAEWLNHHCPRRHWSLTLPGEVTIPPAKERVTT